MASRCIYKYIQYVVGIYLYILVYTGIYNDSYPVTGFRGGHRDAAMLDASQKKGCMLTGMKVVRVELRLVGGARRNANDSK